MYLKLKSLLQQYANENNVCKVELNNLLEDYINSTGPLLDSYSEYKNSCVQLTRVIELHQEGRIPLERLVRALEYFNITTMQLASSSNKWLDETEKAELRGISLIIDKTVEFLKSDL